MISHNLVSGQTLRGRAGTESAALAGHMSGSLFTQLDERLIEIGPDILARATDGFAAIGQNDAGPVTATLENRNASLRPPCPVHPRKEIDNDGSVIFCWTRRARGAWTWPDEVEQPFVEQEERYEIGLGPLESPAASWFVETNRWSLPADEAAALAHNYSGKPLWVRQIGSFARSPALFLGLLP